MPQLSTSTCSLRLALALLGILAADACGPFTLCSATTPRTLALPLALSSDSSLASGSCSAACVALAAADNAQQTVAAASDCAFAPGYDAEVYVTTDGGPGISCNWLSYPTSVDGGTCAQACLAILGDGGFVSECHFEPYLISTSTVVDGGPAVTCSGTLSPVPTSDFAVTACQSVCLHVFADGGGASIWSMDPSGAPSACAFTSASDLYSIDAGTFSDGGPGVSCTWQVANSCDWSM